MKEIKSIAPVKVWVIWLAVGLAVLTSITYLMIAFRFLAVGDLQVAEDGGAIIFVAAGCYFLGGLLVLLRRRWLWIIGAMINALVILFFFKMYQGRPEVMFSPGGMVSKAAQLLLEFILIFMIFTIGSRSDR